MIGGSSPGASVAMRSGSYMTATRDYNSDGLTDRLLVFYRTDLVNAGLSTTNPQMIAEDKTGSYKFEGTDSSPPTITS